MLTPDNTEFERAAFMADDGAMVGDLLGFLAGHAEKPLVFFYAGRAVKPGYHVTEVKAGQFSALDCGANPESWTEIFVQLWDVDEGGRVELSPRPASCKPRDRWLAGQARAEASCCTGSAPAGQKCCG